MLTTGNVKLNEAAKQLVIIKQQKEKILDKLCKNETAKDSEGSDMFVPPTKKRKLHWLKITMGTNYTGFSSFREWCRVGLTIVPAYAAWHQVVPICMEWWCTEANEATQTHCYNLVAPVYLIWAYYAHGWQRRCQEDPVGLPSGRLEKTTGSSPHHMAQHYPTGSETSPSYAPRSSRFGSEPPSLEDDVDVWRYAIVSCMPETTMIGPPVVRGPPRPSAKFFLSHNVI